MRTTDRMCWAGLIRLAHNEREKGQDVGVSLPHANGRKNDWRKDLRDLATTLNVPVRDWKDPGKSYGLEHRAGCYGGGVRPYYFENGCSGHYTPSWWAASAGLGPGATNRETFCLIVSAVSEAA